MKYKKIFNKTTRKFHFPKYKEFFQDGFFLFVGLEPESALGNCIICS